MSIRRANSQIAPRDARSTNSVQYIIGMVHEMTTVQVKTPYQQESGGDELRWQAVLARDRRFDVAFVYAVRSTGIYCRPSCPSRRPNRQHVVFLPGREAAENQGFRSCRRCRPDQRLPVDRQLEMVRTVCRHIQDNQDGPITLTRLSSLVGTSPGHLQRVFKRTLGVSPRQFADACRQDKFKDRLQSGWDITDAMYDSGYGSSSRLYESASDNLGMSPASYRRGAKGIRIAYTTVICPMGRLLVAATEKGVCAVKIGGREAGLVSDLRKEFRGADLHQDDPMLGDWVEALSRHLAGSLPELDLPLDIRATAFQRQVWEHLKTIPYGETRSYQQVASELGRPGGARAVGRACAANPVAVVVPCHRVVRRDGGLGGYRWGMERKAALLAQERSGKQTVS